MKWHGGVLGVVLWAGALAAGCSEGEPAIPVAPVVAAPAPLAVGGDRDGVVYRYLDPASGDVATAASIGDIPDAARAQVVVFDTNSPPPPGWDLVADLSHGLPTKAQPQASFSFAVAARPPAVAVAEHANHEVVMFSSVGCGYCKQARRFFKSNKIPYTELDIEADADAPARLASLAKRAGVPRSQLQGVPIIFVDAQVVLGWDEARLHQLLHI